MPKLPNYKPPKELDLFTPPETKRSPDTESQIEKTFYKLKEKGLFRKFKNFKEYLRK